MDLIERTSVLEIVRRTSGDYATAFSEIGRLPAVDTTPVRHGQFNRKEYIYGTRFTCSVCGCKCTRPYNYCPNCGAKMDGGEVDAKET